MGVEIQVQSKSKMEQIRQRQAKKESEAEKAKMEELLLSLHDKLDKTQKEIKALKKEFKKLGEEK